MKTISDFLFRLIHSMSKNEKGYFKKQVLAHSPDTDDIQYFKLFEAIDKQKEYDEEKLLIKFKDEKFTIQFSVAKNYLSHLLLKSLVLYHTGKNAESNLNRELDFSHILFTKGFYKECRATLVKAKKLSYKFDKHDYTITVIKKEKQLIASLKNEDMVYDLQRLLEEEIHVLNMQRVESELSVVYYNFLNEIHKSRIRNIASDKNTLDSIYYSIPKDHELLLATFNNKSYYYAIETIYNYLLNDFEKSCDYGLKHRLLWEEDADRFNDDNIDYLEVLYHYLGSCFQIHKYEEIYHCITKVSTIQTNSIDQFQRKCFIYYTTGLRYYATLAHYDEMAKLLEEIESKGEDIIDDLYPSYKITLCLNCTITYFIQEDYRKSIKWFNSCRNKISKEFRRDAYSFVRIFNLMLQYKLGNYDLLEHAINNAYREIRNSTGNFQYEKMMLQYFKRITHDNSRKNIIKRAKELKLKLAELNETPVERDAMRYFNFGRWLESEITLIPYRVLGVKETGR